MEHRLFTNQRLQSSWKISILGVFAFLLYATNICSQNIRGKVIDSNQEILEGANVIALGNNNHTICFSITDGNGVFDLTIPDSVKPQRVTVRYMGYETLDIPFSNMKDGMTITMKAGKFQLKEVKVKASKIRTSGDTLSYSVNAFKQGQDRSIADVIKKMPGLEVSENGSVSYQGMPINKFYIEGLDLMGSQYGIANKNLSAEKIKSVQVLKNHQPVNSLRGVSFSDQAALNLVLKDGSKDVWTGVAELGLGYGKDFLYDGRIMGMQFNKSKQALVMYKTNDTGKNIADEINRFKGMNNMLNDPNDNEEGILSLLSVGGANIDRQRYTFNHSHLLAGNWLLKFNKDTDLRLQGNGVIDKSDMGSYRSTTYLNLPDLPVIVEEQDATNYKSQWKGEMNYQSNGSQTFICNNLQGDIQIKKSIGSTRVNDQMTEMLVKPHRQHLADNFRLSHTTKKGHVYEIKGMLSYLHLPGELLTINDLTEKLDLKFLAAAGALQYKLKLGKQYLNNEVGANYNYQDIHAAYQQNSVYWQPSLSFDMGSHLLNVFAKLSFLHQSYRESKSNKAFIEPRLSWRWDFSPLSQITASASITNTPLTGKQIYDTPLFTSYRSQKTNRGQVETQRQTAFTLGYQYTNPIKGLFFNIRPFLNIKTGNILYESNMENNIYILKASDKDYTNRAYGARGRISKSFSWASLFIGLSDTYIVNQYKLLIGNQLDKAQMTSNSVKLDYSLHPCPILSIEGATSFKSSKQENKSEPNRFKPTKVSSWEHHLDFHLLPNDHWMVSLSNELYHSKGKNLGVNYYCDFSVGYKTKRWEMSLITNNLFGTSQFKHQSLSNTVMSYTITTLRPREYMIKYSMDL